MTRTRHNTAATHHQHVDRIHSKRIVELATGICENATDVARLTYTECVEEQRALTAAVEPIHSQLREAKGQGRTGDVILIGNRIDALSRRLAALRIRRKELHAKRIGEGKRFLKAAMRDLLTEDQVAAVFARASELEAAAVQQQGLR